MIVIPHYPSKLLHEACQSNFRYIPVALFIVENEDASSIEEALETIKGWNAGIIPKTFIVDYSNSEINALETVFPGNYGHFETRPKVMP